MLKIHLQGKRAEVKAALKALQTSFLVLESPRFYSLRDGAGVSVRVTAYRSLPAPKPAQEPYTKPSNQTSLPFESPNQQRSKEATERVMQAISHLKNQGKFPDDATARAKAIISASKELSGIGISQTTLHKQSYLPLWHPKYCPMDSG